MTAQHLSIDELVDAAEGVTRPRARSLRRVAYRRLADCRAQSEALHEITGILRTEPPLPMPEAVAPAAVNRYAPNR